MASIIPFLPEGMRLRDSVFEAHEIKAMSAAFGKVCEAMNFQGDSSAEQAVAARIINLACHGECSPDRLYDTVLQEALSRCFTTGRAGVPKKNLSLC